MEMLEIETVSSPSSQSSIEQAHHGGHGTQAQQRSPCRSGTSAACCSPTRGSVSPAEGSVKQRSMHLPKRFRIGGGLIVVFLVVQFIPPTKKSNTPETTTHDVIARTSATRSYGVSTRWSSSKVAMFDNSEASDDTSEEEDSVDAIYKAKAQLREELSQYSMLSQKPSVKKKTIQNPQLKTAKKTKPLHKLEFIHITKTGGSAVEQAAASATPQVLWGACHYMKIPFLGCMSPDLDRHTSQSTAATGDVKHPFAVRSPWHVPLQYNSNLHFVSRTGKVKPGIKLFTILRNPYDRIISEYYCPWEGYKGPDKDNPKILNAWIQYMLKRVHHHPSTHYYNGTEYGWRTWESFDFHALPQYHYVLNAYGEQMVHHLLKYENLAMDFKALMRTYQLSHIRLPKRPVNVARTKSTKLTPKHFTKGTVKVLNLWYKKDFELFGYEMLDPDGVEFGGEMQGNGTNTRQFKVLPKNTDSTTDGTAEVFLKNTNGTTNVLLKNATNSTTKVLSNTTNSTTKVLAKTTNSATKVLSNTANSTTKVLSKDTKKSAKVLSNDTNSTTKVHSKTTLPKNTNSTTIKAHSQKSEGEVI